VPENQSEPLSRYRLSWIIFISPVIVLIAGYGLLVWMWTADKVGFYGVLYRVAGTGFMDRYVAVYPNLVFAGRVVTAVVAALLFLLLFARIVVYLSTELRIFKEMVLWRTGFIRRDVLTIAVPEIIGANFNQTVLGRILGYGSITINSRGDDQIVAHTLSGAPAASAAIMALKSGKTL